VEQDPLGGHAFKQNRTKVSVDGEDKVGVTTEIQDSVVRALECGKDPSSQIAASKVSSQSSVLLERWIG